LGEAGFRAAAVEPADVDLPVAGPGDLDAATDLASNIGPAARALNAAEPARRPAATEAIREALARFDAAHGIVMPARIWVVTASV
ncbi:MAG: SAM-dependent methyltransferase, partial [Actinomycetospora chiangmaiensis]|nr:SAM-dependent methyltransferase [Actinomycetospora chiangmaiensis]